MFGTPPSFVEAGEASKVVALLDAGVPLVESQKELTPFQRTVLLKELSRQNEQAQNQSGGTPNAAGQVNQLRQPRGGGGETTVYTNDGDS